MEKKIQQNNHTYTEAGTYTIVETFNYKDSSGKIIGSNKCQSSIKVEASGHPDTSLQMYQPNL